MKSISRSRIIVPFLAPALLVYIAFFVYPAIQALWVSLHDWSGFVPQMKYIGLKNFRELFTDKMFFQAMKNTLLIAVAGGVFIISMALFFAGVLKRPNFKGSKVMSAVFFYPNVVPTVGLGVLWVFVLNDSFGLINGLLRLVGLGNLTHTWLDTTWAFPSVLAVIIWAHLGFYLIIIMAGINKVPETLYEAGRVEGASHWRMFFTITLPLIWDTLIMTIILWFISALKTFDLVFAMTEGGPSGTTQTVSIYLFDIAFGQRISIFRMGYATAMAVILLVVVIVCTSIIRIVTRRDRMEY
jgi:ABC-type sugar transport system permease subunit